MSFLRRRQTLLAAVAQPVAQLPTVVLLLAAAHRLPDPVATHFGLSGAPDGFTGRSSMVLVSLALGVGMGLLLGAVAWFGGVESGQARVTGFDGPRWPAGLSWATAAFVGVVTFGATAGNLDLVDATAASIPWWTFPVALVGALGAGALGARLAPRSPVGAAPVRAEPLVVDPGERVVWSRRAGTAWMPVSGLVVAAIGVVLGFTASWVAGAFAIVAGIGIAWFSTAQVTADARGLTVAFGPFGLPRYRIPADDIAEATAADVAAMQFGGWGYRIVPGGHGLILRSGEALLVTRRSSGRRFTVTVDDAATAARLLSTYSEAR